MKRQLQNAEMLKYPYVERKKIFFLSFILSFCFSSHIFVKYYNNKNRITCSLDEIWWTSLHCNTVSKCSILAQCALYQSSSTNSVNIFSRGAVFIPTFSSQPRNLSFPYCPLSDSSKTIKRFLYP